MKIFPPKLLSADSSLSAMAAMAGLAALVALTAYGAGIAVRITPGEPGFEQQAPPQEGGRGQGRGRGAPPVDTLGEGPWDLATETGSVHVTVVTKGVDHPWGMAFLPDGGMLVTERSGRLRVVRDGVLDPTPIGPLPEIRARVLGGLLDVALHPDFEDNRLIYFAYSKPGEEDAARATTAVARARWDGGPVNSFQNVTLGWLINSFEM